jgi:23S rRNA pseudouridine2605 synthase
MTHTTHSPPASGERTAKVIAHAGIASRRAAETLIAEKRVALNGQTVTTPATLVRPGDTVTVDSEPLPAPAPVRLWLYHKPQGLLVTHKDPQGRPTIFEHLPETLPRVVTVGRLDFNSEGLLLLTTSGALARHLELPATGWTRRYRVRVHGRVDAARLATLADGVTVDGIAYGPIAASIERQQGANAWLSVALKEGKNREVRRVMEALGYPVSRLIRVAYGGFQLGGLPAGELREVAAKVLREQVGALTGVEIMADSKPRNAPAHPHGKKTSQRPAQGA